MGNGMLGKGAAVVTCLLALGLTLPACSAQGRADEGKQTQYEQVVAIYENGFIQAPEGLYWSLEDFTVDEISKSALRHTIFEIMDRFEWCIFDKEREGSTERVEEFEGIYNQYADLLSRVVNTDEDDAEALRLAYDDMLGILGIDPAWL